MRPASAESMPQMQAYILHDIRKGQVSEMKKVILILVDGLGPDFEPGIIFEHANICDIAPTITTLMGIEAVAEWEGKSLLC